MNRIFLTLSIWLCSFCPGWTQPGMPTVGNHSLLPLPLDQVPESEINIPILVDLTPFYALANKKVDTLFTSPNFPNDWVQQDCSTRFKYSFRRGPLQFTLHHTKLDIGFTGYYKIIGSTRACVNGNALSPWTPACQCGFDEGERKVAVGFTIDISLLTNYSIKMLVSRQEPKPLDKCSVCFWGQDITGSIIEALKKELDISKKDLEKAYGRIDLKPQFQRIWNLLNSPYSVQNMGWFQMNPQKIRINSLRTIGHQLQLNIGLAAKPVIRFEKPPALILPVPHISAFSRNKGFQIFTDLILNYDSLSKLLTSQISGREFIFEKAFIKKKFIFQQCRLMGGLEDRLIMQIQFSGTNKGYFYLTGKPIFDAATHTLRITDVVFDIKSKDFLLKTADWLFSKKITREIEKMAHYDVTEVLNTAKSSINQQINQNFMNGIRGSGMVTNITVAGIFPQSQWLALRSFCEGNLQINVSNLDIAL